MKTGDLDVVCVNGEVLMVRSKKIFPFKDSEVEGRFLVPIG